MTCRQRKEVVCTGGNQQGGVVKPDRLRLPPGATRHLRGGAFAARRFARFPGVVTSTAVLGLECAFDLRLVAPQLPPFPTLAGVEMDYPLD